MDGCMMNNSWLISSNIRAWVVAIIDLRGLTIKFVNASLFLLLSRQYWKQSYLFTISYEFRFVQYVE